MISSAIDRSKQEVLKQELIAQFPALSQTQLQSDSIHDLITEVSKLTHQDSATISGLVERKLEYLHSKSI